MNHVSVLWSATWFVGHDHRPVFSASFLGDLDIHYEPYVRPEQSSTKPQRTSTADQASSSGETSRKSLKELSKAAILQVQRFYPEGAESRASRSAGKRPIGAGGEQEEQTRSMVNKDGPPTDDDDDDDSSQVAKSVDKVSCCQLPLVSHVLACVHRDLACLQLFDASEKSNWLKHCQWCNKQATREIATLDSIISHAEEGTC